MHNGFNVIAHIWYRMEHLLRHFSEMFGIFWLPEVVVKYFNEIVSVQSRVFMPQAECVTKFMEGTAH